MTAIKTKKYSYIDSVRGYAVLMVLATHVFIFGGSEKNPHIFLSIVWIQARMGVMLFYMVSALTLFLSYDHKIKVEQFPVRNFFIRRVFRIVPLFYLVCIYMVIFHHFDTTTIISTFTFMNGFMPKQIFGIVVGGWSVAVEMIFYLTVPFLFRYVNSIKKAFLFFIFTLALSSLLQLVVLRYPISYFSTYDLNVWTLFWLPLQLPVFAMGIFLYFLFFKSDFNPQAQLKFYKPLGYLLVFLGIYFFIIGSYSSRLFINENIGLGFGLLLFITGMAVYPKNYMNNRVAQFFGKISYSFYLLHPIVITWVGLPVLKKIAQFINPTVGFAICFFLLLGLTSVASYISYLYIEQPFQRLGARLIGSKEKRQLDAAM